MSMKVHVIFGPPGAGKGTQCDLLVARLGVKHVSTGGILRSEIASGSELGMTVKDVVAQGLLVDDSLLFSCLKAYLSREALSGSGILLLDGVPRNAAQVAGLDEVLSTFSLKVEGCLSLVAPVESLISRFARRWTCSCGYVGTFAEVDEARNGLCPKCGKTGAFSRRADDEPSVVSRRMEVYRQETEPVAKLYCDRNLLVEIGALRSVEEVYVEVGAVILGRLSRS